MIIEISKIKPSKNNPRKTFKNIEELAKDIEQNGLLNKILVRKIDNDSYELVHGERRFRALKLLRRNNAECEVRQLTEQQAQDIALAENIQREDLTPIELANELKRRLKDTTQQELAKKIGKSQTYISQNLELLELSHYAQVFLNNGYITKEHAKEILRFQKYLKMLQYDKQDTFVYEGRENNLMTILVADLVDDIVCRDLDAKQLVDLVDVNIHLRIRYSLKEKGEEFNWNGVKFIKKQEPLELDSETFQELVVWLFKKWTEWCNHVWIDEDYDGKQVEPYCEKCGVLRERRGKNDN